MRKYRKKNSKKIARQMKKSRRQLKREKMLMVLKYLAQHPCACGESDPCCLDFDHVRGKKLHAISYMINNVNSDEKIFKEIAKCEVRCANCHRRKTAQERKYYSYIDFDTMTVKMVKDQ
jgi:cytochrome c553